MQKVLGQDIKNLDERKQFLIDNADEVVEMDYSKAFDADELAKKKTTLAEKSIKIHDLQEEIKDFKAEKNLSQIVDSNMPDRFFVVLPIFKGTKAQSIEVETYATINGHDVTVQLISPSAQQVVEETLDTIIDEQIEDIKKIAPEIPFIEK